VYGIRVSINSFLFNQLYMYEGLIANFPGTARLSTKLIVIVYLKGH
jgi:hypothetical protein